MNRDPIAEYGGVNLYAFVANGPVGKIDRLGRLTFTVEGYQSVKDMGVAPTAVMPGDTPTADPSTTLAMTGLTWTINSKCKCKKSKWHLDDTSIKMHAVVHLRPSYSSSAQEQWVKDKEQDHVADWNWWGRNEGKRAAQTQEDTQKNKQFDSKTACQSDADSKMQDALRASAQIEVKQTIQTYDTTGLHTWTGP